MTFCRATPHPALSPRTSRGSTGLSDGPTTYDWFSPDGGSVASPGVAFAAAQPPSVPQSPSVYQGRPELLTPREHQLHPEAVTPFPRPVFRRGLRSLSPRAAALLPLPALPCGSLGAFSMTGNSQGNDTPKSFPAPSFPISGCKTRGTLLGGAGLAPNPPSG